MQHTNVYHNLLYTVFYVTVQTRITVLPLIFLNAGKEVENQIKLIYIFRREYRNLQNLAVI